MHQFYDDIIEKLGPPLWFDEFAVPRYCEFAPHRAGNIHASEVALVKIQCLSCASTFEVAFSRPNITPNPVGSLAELIVSRDLRYGDPPNVRCCRLGPAMGSASLRVLQYWRMLDRRRGWMN